MVKVLSACARVKARRIRKMTLGIGGPCVKETSQSSTAHPQEKTWGASFPSVMVRSALLARVSNHAVLVRPRDPRACGPSFEARRSRLAPQDDDLRGAVIPGPQRQCPVCAFFIAASCG